MASISLQGIKKSFDQFPVITDADIAVRTGSSWSLLVPPVVVSRPCLG